jgi:hypothetical protein
MQGTVLERRPRQDGVRGHQEVVEDGQHAAEDAGIIARWLSC